MVSFLFWRSRLESLIVVGRFTVFEASVSDDFLTITLGKRRQDIVIAVSPIRPMFVGFLFCGFGGQEKIL